MWEEFKIAQIGTKGIQSWRNDRFSMQFLLLWLEHPMLHSDFVAASLATENTINWCHQRWCLLLSRHKVVIKDVVNASRDSQSW